MQPQRPWITLLFALPLFIASLGFAILATRAAPSPETATKVATGFLAALEAESFAKVSALLASGAMVRVPFGFDGATDPDKLFRAPMGIYLAAAFLRFSQIKFEDVQITPSADGTRVFIEARGNLIIAGNGRSYRNLYVWRLNLDQDGKIASADEYANPVTIAIAFDEKLGIGAPVRSLEKGGL